MSVRARFFPIVREIHDQPRSPVRVVGFRLGRKCVPVQRRPARGGQLDANVVGEVRRKVAWGADVVWQGTVELAGSRRVSLERSWDLAHVSPCRACFEGIAFAERKEFEVGQRNVPSRTIFVQLAEAHHVVSRVSVVACVLSICDTVNSRGRNSERAYVSWRVGIHSNFHHPVRDRRTREYMSAAICADEDVDEVREIAQNHRGRACCLEILRSGDL